MHLIINLSKHSSEMSDEVIKKHRGIIAILTCLMDVDLFVKEVAFRTINTIVCHNANFSQFVANFSILPKIVLCLKEQQPNLKLHTLSTLNELAKCNQDLAWKIVNLSVLPDVMDFLSPNFTNIQIQRISLNLIKNIVKHSLSLTKKMIESHLFPNILLLMAHPDESIRNNSAKVVHNIVEHDIQITEMVITAGGIVSLLNVISCRKKLSASSAILALGHIAAMSSLFASAVIQSKALKHLTAVLESNTDNNNVKGDVAWTLGMIGQHSSKHSNSVRACDAVTTMINIYMDASVKNEIKDKCKTSIQLVLSKCDDFTTLENLLSSSTSADIISCILDKISKTLLKNVKARRSFIENGYLKMIQNFEPEIDSELFRAIKAVKCCFPDDIIQMVAGGFPESIMKKVDKCIPKNRCT